MPEYHDESPRKRPRRRSRSSSPQVDQIKYHSPHRFNHREEGSRHGRREDRESSKSPPRRRRRSRSREDYHRRRAKDAAGTSSASRHHGEFLEERKYSSRYHSQPRSPPSNHRRRDSHSPPLRRNRPISHSPRPNDAHQKARDRDRHHDRKSSPRPQDDPSSTTLISSKRSNAPLLSQQAAFTKTTGSPGDAISKDDAKPEKQKPNYAPSGLLAAETNTVANTNIVLKYNEPPESRLPPSSQPWRLYVFKNKDLLDTIPLHTRPCWLFGRETAVCDVAVEHPSASKQHAVLQFRYLEKTVGEFGEKKGKVGLYILDLDSANGTKLNGEVLPSRRFVECRTGDMVQFGESTREYVVLLPPKD